MIYDLACYPVLPIIKDKRFHRIANQKPYNDFLIDLATVVSSRSIPLLMFDIGNISDLSDRDIEPKDLAEYVVQFFNTYKELASVYSNPISFICSTPKTLVADLMMCSHVKKYVGDHDIAIVGVEDPQKIYNENKDYVAYAVGIGSNLLHLENVFKYQPVGPLFSTNDLLRSYKII